MRRVGSTMHKIAMLGALTALGLLAGCRQDMHDQPKFFPQRGTTFPGMSGRSVQPQLANTVARGQLHEDAYFYTGLVGGKEGDALPFPVTRTVLERGQERYNVYCTPCHSRVGNGMGMVVERGYRQAGDFHTERLKQAGLGHFFNVMTNGYGAMPDYAAQLTPQDRWAVAAYIRALQLSQNAKTSDVPAGAKVQTLSEIEKNVGLEEGFINDWTVPATGGPMAPAVAKPVQSATPTPNVTPGVAPATQQNMTAPPLSQMITP